MYMHILSYMSMYMYMYMYVYLYTYLHYMYMYTHTWEGLYEATRCRGVSWVERRASTVVEPFLMRKEAAKVSPLMMARWRRLLPSASTLSRSHLWLTSVVAMPSWRFSSAKLRGMFPSLSHSLSR